MKIKSIEFTDKPVKVKTVFECEHCGCVVASYGQTYKRYTIDDDGNFVRDDFYTNGVHDFRLKGNRFTPVKGDYDFDDSCYKCGKFKDGTKKDNWKPTPPEPTPPENVDVKEYSVENKRN